jgi:hypothetical protein
MIPMSAENPLDLLSNRKFLSPHLTAGMKCLFTMSAPNVTTFACDGSKNSVLTSSG